MGFFDRQQTQAAIDRLAAVDDLTIFVGAGSSIESGLPSWHELIMALLRRVGREAGIRLSDVADLDHFCDWTVYAEGGLPGAGATAKAWLGDSFVDVVRRELYSGSGPSPRPGPTALGVARLFGLLGSSASLVTTNYDTLLENALRVSGAAPSGVITYVTTTRPRHGETPVRHLHGVLTPNGRPQGFIVLSEADYFEMQVPNRWQERFCQERLGRTQALFMGASLTDPNLLRYLYRSTGAQLHTAVLVSQRDAWSLRDDVSPRTRSARDAAGLRRWRAMGVDPLIASYYSESGQFPYEVATRRQEGNAYVPLPSRLADWESAMIGGLLQRRSQARFRESQDRLQILLQSWLRNVVNTLEGSGVEVDDQLLGLHLWVHSPSRRRLILWGSSDRVWRQPDALEGVPINWPTPWVAVEAFCTGTPVNQDTREVWASRWNFVMGFPVIIDTLEWGRLPVGVLTLASTSDGSSSSLAAMPADVLDSVGAYLSGNAADLLAPG